MSADLGNGSTPFPSSRSELECFPWFPLPSLLSATVGNRWLGGGLPIQEIMTALSFDFSKVLNCQGAEVRGKSAEQVLGEEVVVYGGACVGLIPVAETLTADFPSRRAAGAGRESSLNCGAKENRLP